MLRITTWRVTGTQPPDSTPQKALQAFDEMCKTLAKIPGAGAVRFYVGSSGFVTVGEPKNYAAADTILSSKDAQTVVAKVFALGFGIVEDHFLLEPPQVVPFTEAAQAVPASLSRN